MKKLSLICISALYVLAQEQAEQSFSYQDMLIKHADMFSDTSMLDLNEVMKKNQLDEPMLTNSTNFQENFLQNSYKNAYLDKFDYENNKDLEASNDEEAQDFEEIEIARLRYTQNANDISVDVSYKGNNYHFNGVSGVCANGVMSFPKTKTSVLVGEEYSQTTQQSEQLRQEAKNIILAHKETRIPLSWHEWRDSTGDRGHSYTVEHYHEYKTDAPQKTDIITNNPLLYSEYALGTLPEYTNYLADYLAAISRCKQKGGYVKKDAHSPTRLTKDNIFCSLMDSDGRNKYNCQSDLMDLRPWDLNNKLLSKIHYRGIAYPMLHYSYYHTKRTKLKCFQDTDFTPMKKLKLISNDEIILDPLNSANDLSVSLPNECLCTTQECSQEQDLKRFKSYLFDDLISAIMANNAMTKKVKEENGDIVIYAAKEIEKAPINQEINFANINDKEAIEQEKTPTKRELIKSTKASVKYIVDGMKAARKAKEESNSKNFSDGNLQISVKYTNEDGEVAYKDVDINAAKMGVENKPKKSRFCQVLVPNKEYKIYADSHGEKNKLQEKFIVEKRACIKKYDTNKFICPIDSTKGEKLKPSFARNGLGEKSNIKIEECQEASLANSGFTKIALANEVVKQITTSDEMDDLRNANESGNVSEAKLQALAAAKKIDDIRLFKGINGYAHWHRHRKWFVRQTADCCQAPKSAYTEAKKRLAKKYNYEMSASERDFFAEYKADPCLNYTPDSEDYYISCTEKEIKAAEEKENKFKRLKKQNDNFLDKLRTYFVKDNEANPNASFDFCKENTKKIEANLNNVYCQDLVKTLTGYFLSQNIAVGGKVSVDTGEMKNLLDESEVDRRYKNIDFLNKEPDVSKMPECAAKVSSNATLNSTQNEEVGIDEYKRQLQEVCSSEDYQSAAKLIDLQADYESNHQAFVDTVTKALKTDDLEINKCKDRQSKYEKDLANQAKIQQEKNKCYKFANNDADNQKCDEITVPVVEEFDYPACIDNTPKKVFCKANEDKIKAAFENETCNEFYEDFQEIINASKATTSVTQEVYVGGGNYPHSSCDLSYMYGYVEKLGRDDKGKALTHYSLSPGNGSQVLTLDEYSNWRQRCTENDENHGKKGDGAAKMIYSLANGGNCHWISSEDYYRPIKLRIGKWIKKTIGYTKWYNSHYCCGVDGFAALVQQLAIKQLGKTPQEACNGLTLDEFDNLDLSEVDPEELMRSLGGGVGEIASKLEEAIDVNQIDYGDTSSLFNMTNNFQAPKSFDTNKVFTEPNSNFKQSNESNLYTPDNTSAEDFGKYYDEL